MHISKNFQKQKGRSLFFKLTDGRHYGIIVIFHGESKSTAGFSVRRDLNIFWETVTWAAAYSLCWELMKVFRNLEKVNGTVSKILKTYGKL